MDVCMTRLGCATVLGIECCRYGVVDRLECHEAHGRSHALREIPEVARRERHGRQTTSGSGPK